MRHFIKYTLAIIFIVAVIMIIIHFAKIEYKNFTNEEIKTEMLQIRAKAKLEFEKYHINNENGLIGEKIVNVDYNIDEEGNFFKWTKDILNELGLTQNSLKDDEYYLINYDTEDVIYSVGIKDEEGNVYYRLSEIEKLDAQKKEESIANNSVNENNETAEIIEKVDNSTDLENEGNTETE